MKKKNNWFTKSITFFSVAIVAIVSAYLLTPNKTTTINLNDGINSADDGEIELTESYLDRFVNHIKDSADANSEDEISGLKASLNNLTLSWGTTLGENPKNTIALNGDLLFKMANLNDIQFTLDLDANYNGKDLKLGICYVSQTVYFALKDLRLKSSYIKTQELLDTLYNLFFNADNAQGLGMTVDIDNFLNEKIANIDFGELLGKLSSENKSTSFSVETIENKVNKEVTFNINLDITEYDITTMFNELNQEEETIKTPKNVTKNVIKVVINSETLGLKKVDLNNYSEEKGKNVGITFGDFNIKGVLECETIPGLQILGFDHEDYEGYQAGKTFTEIINFKSWAYDILDLLQSRKVGFELSANMTLDATETKPASRLMGLDASVNVDFSELFDLTGKKIGVKDNEDEPQQQLGSRRYTRDLSLNAQDILDKVLDSVKLGVNVSITGQEVDEDNKYVEYANLGVNYSNQTAYIALNETDDNKAVMRAKATTATLNNVISKVSDMTSTLPAGTSQKLGTLFSFITDSPLVSAIKDGVYDGILDILETFQNDDQTIKLVLNLSSLGLGNSSKVTILLTAKDLESTDETNVLSITGNDIEIGSSNLDFTFTTHEFSSDSIDNAERLDSFGKYDDLNYLPTVFDQVSSILDNKKAAFSVDGTVKDNNELKLDIDGWGKFDYGTKYGFGTIDLQSYKDGSLGYDHKINLDVNNYAQELKDRNVRFTYGPNEGIKGKFTVQTVTDIFELVTTFIDEIKEDGDERFTKFLDPILNGLGFSYIGDIISSRDYLKFAKNNVLQEIKEYNSGSVVRITVNGEIFGLEDNIVIELKLTGEGENRKLEGLSLPGLQFSGKTISLNITLKEFDDYGDTPVDLTQSFLDFSDIKVLLDFGINTTRLNYYHLTADIDIEAIKIFNIKFTLDFYIQVTGVSTKVYGVIEDVPYVIAVSNDALTDVKSEFVFEPDHNASNNDIGGYFHILRTEKHKGLFNRSTEKYYYKSDSKNFLDKDNGFTNLIYYLVVDMLDIKSSLASMIVDSSLSSGNNADPDYEKAFTDKGFKYTHTSTKDSWEIGLDLKSLTGVSALGDLDLKIEGNNANNNKGYLSKLNANITLVSVVKIKAVIDLKDIDPSLTTWDSSIEQKYSNITSIYSKLSASNKTKFTNNYYNNPLKDFKI